MTEKSLQARNRELKEELTKLAQIGRAVIWAFIESGRIYKRIQKRKLYVCAGDHIKNFEDFLSSDEVSYGRTTIYNMMKTYDLFKTEHKSKILDIPPGTERLQKLLPVMTEKNKWKVIRGAPESRKEFEEYIRELKKIPIPVECNHEKTIDLKKCVNCGQVWKVQKTLDK